MNEWGTFHGIVDTLFPTAYPFEHQLIFLDSVLASSPLWSFFCDLVHSFHRWLSPCASNYTMNSRLFNGTIVLQICLSHSLNVLEDRDHAFSVFTSGALRSAWFIGRFSTYIWWINHIPWSVGFTHQRTPRREHVKNHGNAPSKIWTLPRDCMHGLFLASSF